MTKRITITIPAEHLSTKLLGTQTLWGLLKAYGAEKVETTEMVDVDEGNDIDELWSYYIDTFHSNKTPEQRPSLLADRRALLRARRRKWSVEQLKEVMSYIAKQPFYMGDNDRNKKYIDLKNFMGSDSKVERHLLAMAEMKVSQSGNFSTDTRLILEELGSKMRSGTASIEERDRVGRLATELRKQEGVVFDWRTGTFAEESMEG